VPQTDHHEPTQKLISVAVPVAQIRDYLTYAVPASMAASCQIGKRVLVPIGRKKSIGLVFDENVPAPKNIATKCILEVLDENPVVTLQQLNICRFISRYYFVSPGESARLVLPPDTPRALQEEYRITAKGKSAQVFGPAMGLSKRDMKLLEGLDTAGPKNTKQLKQNGISAAKRDQFLRKELLEVVSKKALRKHRTQEWVHPLENGDPLPKRAHALAELDHWIRTQQSPPQIVQCQSLFKNAKGKIERLRLLKRIRLESQIRPTDPPDSLVVEDRSFSLSLHQEQAIHHVWASHDLLSRAFLLEGVTGSGKTEVYLQLLNRTLNEGKGAILVVPEIALTPQLLARVRDAISEDICILHSGLSPADRRDTWGRLLKGDVKVVIGARSALFAPIRKLGLIIIDEEHDSSLKQSENPRYHGRDVALWRSHQEKAICVLGSATPSLESRHNAATGKLQHLRLPERIAGAGQMPQVKLVDLRAREQHYQTRKRDASTHEEKGPVILSEPLRHALLDTYEAGEQSLLFLNRRGVASVLLCGACGHIPQCPSCSVSLTPHQPRHHLLCHQCDYQSSIPTQCAACGDASLLRVGLGTQRVENEVRALFPEARIARLDRDTIRQKNHLTRTLLQMQNRELDILIGTQMVAKGHDFPAIRTVGIISADTALGFPDFRAAERTFSLLTQVAGRAGRGDQVGQVLIQTYNPEHAALQYALTHDVNGFGALELALRMEWKYPPYWKAALLRIECENAEAGEEMSNLLGIFLRTTGADQLAESDFILAGPTRAPLERLRGKYRFHLLLRTLTHKTRALLLQEVFASQSLMEQMNRHRCRFVLDVDPLDML
jgi:primosomal protein N' (replication factor Y) (superfamily II helicase)